MPYNLTSHPKWSTAHKYVNEQEICFLFPWATEEN